MPPQVEAALDQIEEWVAILAVEVGTAVTAKLLRRMAIEIEELPTAVMQ
jgi:hypothetical protein